MKFKSVIVGLLAGAGLGILFAPKKGKELRQEIIKERAKGGTGLEELGEAMKDSAAEAVTYSQRLWKKAEKLFNEKFNEDEQPKKSKKKGK